MTARLRLLLSLVAAFGLLAALPQATLAKKRHHRRAGCSKFCRQAGGFGGAPQGKLPVRIRSQKIRIDDGLIGIRARCTLEHTCVGAIIVLGSNNIEYGRADLRIAEDRTRIVYVRLSRAGRSYLKRHGRDRQVFAAVALKGNHPASFSKRLTLIRNDR
ncbi:MAG: hypothetical protein QOI19_2244 [Thermoleophilaceae bacterium]|nr:hypothetical protein [Thermoleophilaceae bacterium]